MKKIILILLLSFLFVNYTHAQTHVRDSLKNLIKNEKRDTVRVMLLNELSFQYVRSTPDSAMRVALEALALSQKISFDKGTAASLNKIGNAYYAAGNGPKAMEVWVQAMKINEKINNLDGKEKILANIGLVYESQGQHRLDIEYSMRSKKINEQINNQDGLAGNFINISRAYNALARYDSAMIYAQKAYEIEKKFGLDRLGTALVLMGSINSKTGGNSLALDYYRLSVEPYRLTENKGGLSSAYFGMAKIYDKGAVADSALYYAKKAFALSYSVGKFTSRIDETGSFLSGLYQKKGRLDSAYFYLRLAKTAKDSVTSQQRMSQFQNLGFDEKLRLIEAANSELKAEEDRKHNLQFAGIAVVILSFLILFFALSRTVIVKENFIRYFNVVVLLAVFEFINLLIHPYLAHLTNDSPPLMLLTLIGIGALLVPLHHKLEHWIAHVLTEKNKQIRLAAAKKTIEHLEGGKRDQE